MLTKRQNLIETINGGNPDRFVKQYEAFAMMLGTPVRNAVVKPGETKKTNWGVTFTWPEGYPGQMPVHTEDLIVVKDITRWRDYVKAPEVVYSDEEWTPFIEATQSIDRNEQFATMFIAPGIFEQCHHLCEITRFMEYLYDEPDSVHELIEFLTDWEIRYAEQFIKHLKPEAVFHHDDWGSHISTLLSPTMFEEFVFPAYKKLYGYYKENGIELIIHHSDSYAATLVPYMIEMGIDIWQGVVTTNNTPELIKEYGGRITFMGDIDSGVIDTVDWSKESIMREVRRACETCGKLYFIPGASQGLAISTFPGVYEATDECIDEMSKEMF